MNDGPQDQSKPQVREQVTIEQFEVPDGMTSEEVIAQRRASRTRTIEIVDGVVVRDDVTSAGPEEA